MRDILKELDELQDLVDFAQNGLVKETRTYTPTEGMASAARRALKWREEGRAGGTSVGLARANQLKNRENLTERTVLRMHSFFSRHAVDKQATGFSSGEEGFPSKGRVAWDLWGGDGGASWSEQKRNQIMRDRQSKTFMPSIKGYMSEHEEHAQTIEDYANQNISEELEAFGQFMYHAQLLRNGHLDMYLMDLYMVAQPYRDILVDIFAED